MVASHAGQRTTVIAAHRLSTVQKCDVIVVLSKGVVAESGSHDALLQKKQARAALLLLIFSRIVIHLQLYWRLAHAQDTSV